MGSSSKAYGAAIVVQVSFAIMSLMSKIAFAEGMNPYIFLFYRQTVGAIVLIPITLFYTRKGGRTPLSLMSFFNIFMLALLGITLGLNAFNKGVDLTSATFGSAAFNCLPVATFLFAALFRMEKINIKKSSGKAKMAGIIVCLAGVAILAAYKGTYLKPLFRYHLLKEGVKQHSGSSWIIGCILLLVFIMSVGLWLVLQGLFMKSYPSTLEFTCIQTLLSSVQTFVVAIAFERDPEQWKLGWNIKLAAVLFCGTVVVCLANGLQSWVVKVKGAVFLAMTTPLNLLVTIIGSEFVLNQGIHVGSLIGAVLLVISLYIVLWGKNKEQKMNAQVGLPISRDKELEQMNGIAHKPEVVVPETVVPEEDDVRITTPQDTRA